MPEPAHARCYRFDRFELQPFQRRLLEAGQPVPMNARAFDLLLALVERRGQLVTKDELLRRVWGRLVVEESNIQVQVSALRKIVGAQAIETVAGHGYRLTMEVDERDAETEATRTAQVHDLPILLTEFLGRERELAELSHLLRETRLLTVTGVGGIGKTRVALELAATAGPGFAEVRLVELASVTDPRTVPYAVAAALGIPDEPGRAIDETVLDRVKDREMLLVLDNCEHLLAACAALARRLLQACPRVTLVATGREPLHVAGESIYALGPLATPGAEDPIDVERLQGFDAIRLFEARARDVNPAFVLSPDRAATVAGICRRLDGIPLAIELAAARMRSLRIEAIAERLRDRFRLLTGGDRTALPRQQTLRATIEWSHGLLTPQEQALLRRLAVFAGGWTVEAAETVGAGGGVAEVEVLDLLFNLVDKSLVVLDGDRYRMLETVREYALERLAESREEDAVRRLHLRFYSALAQSAERALYGPDQRAWLARCDSERENFLLALAQSRCSGAEGAQSGLMILNALRPWLSSSRLELSHQLCVDALAQPEARSENIARSQACATASVVCRLMGRYDESRAWAEESLRIAEKHGDLPAIIDARSMLGGTMLNLDDHVAARHHALGALSLALESGDTIRAAYASNNLGETYALEGRDDLAEPHYAKALALFREAGNVDDSALALLNLARTFVIRGDDTRAAELLLEVSEIVAGRSFAQWEDALLSFCAALAADRAEWLHAGRFHGAAEAHLKRSAIRREPADEAFLAPRLARARSGAPAGVFELAEFEGRALDRAGALAEVKAWLATVA